MNPEENTHDEQKESILSLIQKLRDGTVSAETLDKETRLECTNALRLEGYTIPQIAQILKVSDRAINRYVKELKERNALETDANFTKEFLGDLVQKVSSSFSFLIRLSRHKDTQAPDKIQAEIAASRLLFDLAKLLQSTGYLPLAPQLIGADVYHHVGSLSEQDVLDIEQAAKESIGIAPTLSKVIEDLRNQAKLSESEPKEKNHEPQTS